MSRFLCRRGFDNGEPSCYTVSGDANTDLDKSAGVFFFTTLSSLNYLNFGINVLFFLLSFLLPLP